MRTLLAACSFVAPVLLAVVIGGSLAGGGQARPQLNGAAMGELREYANEYGNLLERYGCDPGQTVDYMPHLALERFDRRGCDRGGQPWYRLGNQHVPCGLLRRAAPGGEPAPIANVDGAVPTMVLPLTPLWAYWERVPRPPP